MIFLVAGIPTSSTPSAARCMYYTHSQKVPSYVGRHLNTRPKVTQQHIAFCESLLCPCCILHSTNADVEHFENLALHKVHSANTKYILWPWSFKPVINITEWDHRFFSVIFFLLSTICNWATLSIFVRCY